MSPADSIGNQHVLQLGCIADDFTGGTDPASDLLRGGHKGDSDNRSSGRAIFISSTAANEVREFW